MANRLATAPRTSALPLWPDVGEDDAETIAADARKDTVRAISVREGCALLLADLKRFEAYPDEMANPDIDRKHVPIALTLKG
jgi:hypothetical protein